MTLRFNSALEQFDDTKLQEFIKDKESLSVRDHFFVKNDTPYITIVIHYQENHEQPTASGSARKRDESWRELIKDDELPLFNTLRSWRSERAKRDGIPPYIICTNRQLAEMVSERPLSLSALAKINGFGRAKVDKYGKAILPLLKTEDSEHTKKDKTAETPTSPEQTARDRTSRVKIAGEESPNDPSEG